MKYADELLEKGQSLQTNNLEEAIKCVQDAISKYFKAKNEAANQAEFQDLVYHIQEKLESARSVQTEQHDKMIFSLE